MAGIGYTRARSMGRIAAAVRRAGGSVDRVFRRVGLPARLIDFPDHVILLRDQFALVEHAVRETGDDMLAPRLSVEVGFRGLGALGADLGAAPRLDTAIARCNAGVATLLQSATHMALERRAHCIAWTYQVSDPVSLGRQRNEILALGYMTDLLRHFLGARFTPVRIEVPGRIPARAGIEAMLGCEIARGDKTAVMFPAYALDAEVRATQGSEPPRIEPVPAPDDWVQGVAQLVRVALLERRPTLAWTAQRLGVSRRTLLRRLTERARDFESILALVLREQAEALLRDPAWSVSEIAYELGYSDPAHFTRAVRAWKGLTPRGWRRVLAGS